MNDLRLKRDNKFFNHSLVDEKQKKERRIP